MQISPPTKISLPFDFISNESSDRFGAGRSLATPPRSGAEMKDLSRDLRKSSPSVWSKALNTLCKILVTPFAMAAGALVGIPICAFALGLKFQKEGGSESAGGLVGLVVGPFVGAIYGAGLLWGAIKPDQRPADVPVAKQQQQGSTPLSSKSREPEEFRPRSVLKKAGRYAERLNVGQSPVKRSLHKATDLRSNVERGK